MSPNNNGKGKSNQSSRQASSKPPDKVVKPQRASTDPSHAAATSSSPKGRTRSITRALRERSPSPLESDDQSEPADGAEISKDQVPPSPTQPAPPTSPAAPIEHVASTQATPTSEAALSTQSENGLPDKNGRHLDDTVSMVPSTDEEERTRWGDHCFSDWAAGLLFDTHWGRLDDGIRRLIDEAFPVSGNVWQSLDSTTKAALTTISPKAVMFVDKAHGSPNSPKLIFTAWIYRILYENLFSSDCVNKWLGEEWAGFGAYRRALQGGVNNSDDPFVLTYHGARYRMARTLYMRYGQHTDPNRLVRIILDSITPVTQLRDDPEDSDVSSVYEPYDLEVEIRKLADSAIQADFYIQASRWNITVEMHHETGRTYGFPFDSALMCCSPGQFYITRRDPWRYRGLPVDFIIKPLLRAYGKKWDTEAMFAERTQRSHLMADRPWICHFHECTHIDEMEVFIDQFPGVGDETNYDIEARDWERKEMTSSQT